MARVEQFIKEISGCQNLMLDTNALIYFLDGTSFYVDIMLALFDMVEQGCLNITISVISEAELMVKPYQQKNTSAIEAINFFMEEFPNLKIIPVTWEISRQAAKIRADLDIRLPDAIILATAIQSNCDLMVGNDLKLMRKSNRYLPIIVLNEYI